MVKEQPINEFIEETLKPAIRKNQEILVYETKDGRWILKPPEQLWNPKTSEEWEKNISREELQQIATHMEISMHKKSDIECSRSYFISEDPHFNYVRTILTPGLQSNNFIMFESNENWMISPYEDATDIHVVTDLKRFFILLRNKGIRWQQEVLDGGRIRYIIG